MNLNEFRSSIGLPPVVEEEPKLSRSARALRGKLSLKHKAVAYMGGSCRICGYSKCMAALEFHHIDPSSKEVEISRLMARVWKMDEHLVWNRVVKELKKCVLLCANCHRELEAGYVYLPTQS